MSIDPLDALHILRSAGGGLLTQATLLAELARVEWAEEKHRMLRILIAAALGAGCLLSAALLVTALLIHAIWNSGYLISVGGAVVGMFLVGAEVARRQLQALLRQSDQAFSATSEEFCRNVSLLRTKP